MTNLTAIVNDVWPDGRTSLAARLDISRQALHALLTGRHARKPHRLLGDLFDALHAHDRSLRKHRIVRAWEADHEAA